MIKCICVGWGEERVYTFSLVGSLLVIPIDEESGGTG